MSLFSQGLPRPPMPTHAPIGEPSSNLSVNASGEEDTAGVSGEVPH